MVNLRHNRNKSSTREHTKDIYQFLEQEKENEYVQHLLDEVSSEDLNLKKVVEYGLTRIKDNEDDFALANYFYALSEIENIPDAVRSFLMDVMIYCEDKIVEFKNAAAIRNFYHKKIEPLIRADK